MATNLENSKQISINTGLVAYFDILGFKSLLLGNPVEESLTIIDTAMLQALDEVEKGFSPIIGKKPFDLETFVISDSILIALPTGEQSTPDARGRGTVFFVNFCAQLMTSLLQKGLPIRGAIAAGDYAVRSEKNRVAFVGQPIADAHDLASSLELAGCAIVPTSESKALYGSAREFGRIYQTPVKKLPRCELYLLEYFLKSCSETGCISREKIIGYFEAHKKQLDCSSLGKLSNTIEFLKKCGQLPSDNDKTQ